MITLIPFSHSDVDRYLINLELATGKKITIDLFPLRSYIEKTISNPEEVRRSVEIMHAVFKEIGITNPEIADHSITLIMLALRYSAICT